MNLAESITGFTSKILAPARLQKQNTTPEPTSLQWVPQSPTPTLVDGVEAFTGAPVIGEVILDTREALDVNKLCTTLHLHCSYRKPLHPKCFHCAHHYAELKQWVFVDGPMALSSGKHSFVFSTRLENDLPSSLCTPLVDFAYELSVELTLGTGTSVRWNKSFPAKRSLCRSGDLQTDTFSFPKARVDAGLRMRQVIEPNGINSVWLSLSAIKNHPTTLSFEIAKVDIFLSFSSFVILKPGPHSYSHLRFVTE